jgi:hypothetical protein
MMLLKYVLLKLIDVQQSDSTMSTVHATVLTDIAAFSRDFPQVMFLKTTTLATLASRGANTLIRCELPILFRYFQRH